MTNHKPKRADMDGDACEKPRDLAKRIRRLAKKEG